MMLKIKEAAFEALPGLVNAETGSLFVLPHLTATGADVLGLPDCALHLSAVSGFFPRHQITHAPYGLDVVRRRRIIAQLAPQPRDVDINAPVQAVIVVLEQLLPVLDWNHLSNTNL